MRIGIFAPLANPFATAEYIQTLGRAAEERGFDSIWVAEHVVLFDEYESTYPYMANGKIPVPPGSGMLDPLVALSYLAACTSTIRLGTGICLLPQRNPVYTAKEAATVDWLSNGRLDLGIGVGWLAEEYEALGVPFDRRGARCRDYVGVLRSLWCDEVSQFDGEFYTLPPTRQFPKPPQSAGGGHPPIHFGGESDAALRRVADLGQGWYGFGLEPDDARERVATLTRMLERRGRSRDEVQVSICPYMRPGTLDLVRAYQDAGVDRVILLAAAMNVEGLVQALDALAESVVAPAGAL